MANMPLVDFFGHKISRLIMGGNPFSGNSHIDAKLDGEMADYYTTENIKKAIIHAQECGINTIQVRGDVHILRILRELKNEGKAPMWVAQTASELQLDYNLRRIMPADPIAIYHHGSITDNYYQAGKMDELHDRIKMIRDTGKPVGLGTHIPEVIDYAEDHGWEVDFYMACVYNISNKDRGGVDYGREPFFESDIPIMLDKIRSVDKPCLAFKILGATRRCQTPETVRAAFEQAYSNIKPCDSVVVGIFQRDKDQIAENAKIVSEIG
ncbi:MAG: hypothetical protein IJB92_05490 [Clostridia bacterium]|nr:hypothetical protein [Clostridia bacterium]